MEASTRNKKAHHPLLQDDGLVVVPPKVPLAGIFTVRRGLTELVTGAPVLPYAA